MGESRGNAGETLPCGRSADRALSYTRGSWRTGQRINDINGTVSYSLNGISTGNVAALLKALKNGVGSVIVRTDARDVAFTVAHIEGSFSSPVLLYVAYICGQAVQ